MFVRTNRGKLLITENSFPLMTRPHTFLALLTLVAAQLLTTPAEAQQGSMSARQGIDAVSAQFGPGAVQWIAEIYGRTGIPQPNSWEILAFSDRSPGLLHRFWAGGGRVGDAGADDSRYPTNVPVGYFSANQVAVDSVAAFTIAEGEARKARMAFDSCDYLLRVREYSTEPIWRLELLDPNRRLVGKIYLSASNGEVLRTVWVYYNTGGRPQIVDSFAPTRPPATTTTTQVPTNPSLNPIQEPGVSVNSGPMAPTTGPAAPSPDTGIAGVVPPPTFPSANGRTGGSLQPYTPGAVPPPTIPPSSERRYNDGGIPEPPAIEGQSSGNSAEMQDLREAPTEEPKPPVDVSGSDGSTDRIPPPPIPNP